MIVPKAKYKNSLERRLNHDNILYFNALVSVWICWIALCLCWSLIFTAPADDSGTAVKSWKCVGGTPKLCRSKHDTSRHTQSLIVEQLTLPVLSWRSGSVVKTSVFGRRTFPDLCLICGWHVTTSWVVSAIGQPTRPTRPAFHPFGVGKWVVIYKVTQKLSRYQRLNKSC